VPELFTTTTQPTRHLYSTIFEFEGDSDLLVPRRLVVSHVRLCRCQAKYRESAVASCYGCRWLPRAAATGCHVFEQLAWCRSNTWTSKYEAKTEEQDDVKFGSSLLTRLFPTVLKDSAVSSGGGQIPCLERRLIRSAALPRG